MRATSLLISGSSSTTSSVGSSESTIPASKLVDERVDARRDRGRVPIAIRDDVVTNGAVLVDQERLRKLFRAPLLGDVAIFVEQDLERRALGEEFAHRRPVVVDADGEQAERLAALLLDEALHRRHLDGAGAAPRRPEVDEHDV